MGRLGCVALLIALVVPAESAWSQTIRYPRVYGATGRPYGPTQAHYQYQRQYGRPWHGYGGITANINANVGYVNGYASPYLSYGYGVYADFGCLGFDCGYYPGLSPFPSYTPPIPPIINGYPPAIPYNPLVDPAVSPLTNPVIPNIGAVNPPDNGIPLPGANPLPPISTPEAKLKSVRAQAQGDEWFQKQEYHKAFDRYKAAVSEAQDRGEAHMRLAVCYVALGHLDLAVRQIKRGMAVDPEFLTKLEPLSKMFGATNGIAQAAAAHKATLWAKEDVRDPDRLFLLGVLLYLQGDDRAVVPLETGLALSGGDHFRGFLNAAKTNPLASPEEAQALGQDANPGPQVIDQAPAPGTQNPRDPNSDEAIPPLPVPPQSNPEGDDTEAAPSGPALSLPNS